MGSSVPQELKELLYDKILKEVLALKSYPKEEKTYKNHSNTSIYGVS